MRRLQILIDPFLLYMLIVSVFYAMYSSQNHHTKDDIAEKRMGDEFKQLEETNNSYKDEDWQTVLAMLNSGESVKVKINKVKDLNAADLCTTTNELLIPRLSYLVEHLGEMDFDILYALLQKGSACLDKTLYITEYLFKNNRYTAKQWEKIFVLLVNNGNHIG